MTALPQAVERATAAYEAKSRRLQPQNQAHALFHLLENPAGQSTDLLDEAAPIEDCQLRDVRN